MMPGTPRCLLYADHHRRVAIANAIAVEPTNFSFFYHKNLKTDSDLTLVNNLKTDSDLMLVGNLLRVATTRLDRRPR